VRGVMPLKKSLAKTEAFRPRLLQESLQSSRTKSAMICGNIANFPTLQNRSITSIGSFKEMALEWRFPLECWK
jgi:hypothetical protein